MATSVIGPSSWWMERTEKNHRDYHITHKVRSTTPFQWSGAAYTGDGPATVLATSGLPTTGSVWAYGNDADAYAYCTPKKTVRPLGNREGAAVSTWLVESIYSTRPSCVDMMEVENPLLQPQKVSGSTNKYTIEAVEDQDGNLLKSSSHEMLRGPQVEFDSSRHLVRVEQNVATLDLALCSSLMDHVNDDELWGLDARRIKLSNFIWEELYWANCFYYYRRIFDFDVRNNEDDLFDRYLLDEGTKVLNGRWATTDDDEDCGTSSWVLVDVCGESPDEDNPQHFIRYKDRNDENSRVLLNGHGLPAETIVTKVISGTGETGTENTGDIAKILVEYYPEADLTQLGIPTNLDFGTGTGN